MAVDYLRPFLSHTNMLDIKEEGLSTDSKSQKKTIHSGHFMVSRVHEPNVDDDEEEAVSPFSDDNKGFDFLNAVKKTSTTYNFGNAIDESLTKLFECMTLAYSGSITSPRWKQFRGLHVSQKQRIRLNNLIWREWHMQYIYQKSPMVCQFAMPLSDDIHSKPEAVVLEGKYWKRRLDVVTAEYKKWRRYYKDQAQRLQLLQTFGGMTWQQDTSHLSEMELLERVKDVTFIPCLGSGIRGDEGIVMQGHSNTDMALEMDFYDDFFNSLNNGPFSFPNPRELNHYGRSDLIQPGLLQLQPNLEECMDTDSLQLDLLTAKIPGAFSSSFHSSIGPAFLQESQSHVEMPQESDALLDFFSNTQGPSSSGQNTNQMSMSAAPSHALHQQPQQQQQQQQQMLSPLAQLMTDNSNAMMESASQNIAFQLNSSVDNHNNNGGQIGLSHSPSIFVDGNQAFTLVSPGVAVTNNSSNINMSLMNTTDQKPIGGNNINVSGGGGGANLAELMTQMLQQEAQKNLQQQLQLQQKQQQLQQQQQKQQQLQQQQQKQQQQLQQQKQQQQQRQQLLQRQQQQQQQRLQQRAKALPLAPKVSPQAQRPTQQDLLQQLLQQQHPPFQQSPSAQSPLLAQSLTSSPSTSPLHNTIDRGLSNTSPHNRTDSQGYSPLSASTSPGITHLSSSPQQQQKKGGRQGRGAHKQSPVRRNSGGGSGGASGVMSDLAKMAAGKKKDGPFAVPQAKSVASTRVNRKIAPAPAAPVPIAPYVPSIPQNQVTVPSSGATASACQDSYLAKLLKNGTYQGAMINVKKEFSQQKQLVSQQHLLSQGIGQSSPIQTTTNLYQQIQNAAPSPPSSATAIVCQIGPQPGSDTLITVPLAGQIQASSLFAGTSVGNLGLGQLSPQTLANVVLPVPLGGQQMEGVSASPAESQHQQASVFARLSEEKVSSVPSSPNSSVTSPPPAFNIKPSSSPPQASMDTSNSLVDPSSPFSMVTMSPSTVGDPTSPAPSDIDFMPDSRRAAHLSAEQKRRWNLKTGFDMLQQLVPSLSQNPRVSKATMLQKTAEFCKKLKAERLEMQKEATILKREIESLNTAISGVQAQLPETGVPMTRQRKDQMREMFDDYVCHRTKENWKFWIFSAIMNPLYDSYCSSVSTASMEELCKTSLTWLDQYCSLVTLRPRVLHSLTKFSTSTSILTEPLRVKDQALQAVEKHPKKPK